MWEEEFKSGDCQFQAHSPGYTRELQHVNGTNTAKGTSTFKSTERCIGSFPNETNISSELLKFKISKY
jgi:hypothetical protein